MLSSVGQALEFLAGTDVPTFQSTVASVPVLLSKAIQEVSAMTTPRKAYSVALLQSANV